jgi:cyclic pyranopterin phosphate synthase
VLRFEEILRFVRILTEHFGLAKVHLTGGDPLVRRGIEHLVAMLAGENVGDLALTTNGQGLTRLAGPLQQAGLGRINVAPVLAGIESARRAGLHPIKLNTVVLRGWNDAQVVRLARWALDHECTIRFLELMPIGCARPFFDDWFVPASVVRARLCESFDLEPLPYRIGDSARYFETTDAAGRRGRIGFIAPATQPFCGGCTRLRLTSTGQLIGCLGLGRGSQLGELLRRDDARAARAVREEIAETLRRKVARAAFDTARAMGAVGG